MNRFSQFDIKISVKSFQGDKIKISKIYCAKRLSQFNKDTKLGFHYLWTREEISAHFDGHLAKSKQIIP